MKIFSGLVLVVALTHSVSSLIELQPNSSAQVADEGSSLTLKCTVSHQLGVAPTAYFATETGIQVKSSADGRKTISAVIDGAKTVLTWTIMNAVKDDGGAFLCVDTNLTTASLKFTIAIVPASTTGGSGISLQPPKSKFTAIAEGVFNVVCFIKNDKGDGKFVNVNTGAEVKTSEGGRIEVLKTSVGTTTALNFTINSVKLTDQAEYTCDGASGSLFFTFKVISRSSVPVVTASPKNATAKPGETLLFYCNASATMDNINTKSLELKWLFVDSVSAKVKDVNPAFYVVNTSNVGLVVNVNSLLTLKSVNASNGGFYICQGIMTFRDGTALDPVEKEINLYEVTPVFDDKDKTEVVYAGNDVKFVCRASGFPFPTITWMKQGSLLQASTDPRYNFSRLSADQPDNSVFTITDVKYTDRGVYECYATSFLKDEKVHFTLRVRDKLGALWPFIGIVVEAIVLAVIIVVYELLKKKTKAGEATKGDGQKTSENSPLVNDTPNVRYTSDKGVRLRGKDGEVA